MIASVYVDRLEHSDKWDRFYLGLAEYYATASKDPSTKVGAVIVNNNSVVGLGYNGFPRGVKDTEERLNDRTWKYPLVAHAELNAIINAGHAARGGTIYVVPTLMLPGACPECSKAIVQAGIKEIVNWHKDNLEGKWADMMKFSKVILEEGGVTCRTVVK
jgi:dCMP deaminase